MSFFQYTSGHFLFVCFSVLACAASNDGPATTSTTPIEDLCTDALEELRDTDIALAKITTTRSGLPTKKQFNAVCMRLPVAAAKCMSIQYQFGHRQDCDRAWQGVPARDRKALQKLSNLPFAP